MRNEKKEADENESSSTHARPTRNVCRPETLYTTVRACVHVCVKNSSKR